MINKQASSDLKIKAIKYYYKINNYSSVCKIFECSERSLKRWIERYEKNKSIAGRDLYDIHHFFFNGFDYNSEVIKERRQKKVIDFLIELVVFIKKEITQTIIDQDINHLIQYDKFKKLRLVIKKETLMFLNDEIERLK